MELQSIKELAEMAALEASIRHQEKMAKQPRGQERWYLTCAGSKFDEVRADDIFPEYGSQLYTPKFVKLVPIPLRELSKKQRQANIRPRREKLVPMFPAYHLVKLDVGADWRELFARTGIFGIVGTEENDRPLPRPIRDSVVEEFRRRELQGVLPGNVSIRDLGFSIDEAVRVADGHFSGYSGTVNRLPNIPIEDVDEDVRVRLAILMFGRVTLVEIPLSHIQKL
jgi:transcription antitermination factor NusG